jgi:hypothetical protein
VILKILVQRLILTDTPIKKQDPNVGLSYLYNHALFRFIFIYSKAKAVALTFACTAYEANKTDASGGQ